MSNHYIILNGVHRLPLEGRVKELFSYCVVVIITERQNNYVVYLCGHDHV